MVASVRAVGFALLLGGVVSVVKGAPFGGVAIGASCVWLGLAFVPWSKMSGERRKW